MIIPYGGTPLQTREFGPFEKGVVTPGNAAAPLTGMLLDAANVQLSGPGRLVRRNGYQVAVPAFPDPSGAACTTICWVGPFGDDVVVLAHQSAGPNAGTVYAYRCTGDGRLQTGGPHATVYANVGATAPDLTATELLGSLFVASADGVLANGAQQRPLIELDVVPNSATNALSAKTVTGSLPTTGSVLYPTGVIGFKSHLWAYGYGSPTDHYRPELARYSQPFLAPLVDANGTATTDLFAASDSIGIGDRLRSVRERIVGACVAGDVLFLGGVGLLTEISGVDRDSWYRRPVDATIGFAGPRSMVAMGATCYFWSERGPARVTSGGMVEPLWPAIRGIVATVRSPATVVAWFDPASDTVYFATTRTDALGARILAGYSILIDGWVDVDGDLGLPIRSAATCSPVYAATATLPGPLAAPSGLTVPEVTQTTVQFAWTAGDPLAETLLRVKRATDAAWTDLPACAPGVVAFSEGDLITSTNYQWDATHRRNGVLLGPVAGPGFQTLSATAPLPAPTGVSLTPVATAPGTVDATVRWDAGSQSGLRGVVELTQDAGATWGVWAVSAPDANSVPVTVTGAGTWQARVRFRIPGVPDSAPTSSAPVLFP